MKVSAKTSKICIPFQFLIGSMKETAKYNSEFKVSIPYRFNERWTIFVSIPYRFNERT